jgi:hypothetical protein
MTFNKFVETAKQITIQSKIKSLEQQIKEKEAELDHLRERQNIIIKKDFEDRQNKFIDLLTQDLIDVLAPKHGRMSCNDIVPQNITRCVRCCLMNTLSNKMFPLSEMDFNFTITGI